MSSPSSEQPGDSPVCVDPVPASARGRFLAMCSLAARGLWREIAPVLREAGERGYESSPCSWSRLARCSPDEFLTAARELLDRRIIAGRADAQTVMLRAAFVTRRSAAPDGGGPGDDDGAGEGARLKKNGRQRQYRERLRQKALGGLAGPTFDDGDAQDYRACATDQALPAPRDHDRPRGASATGGAPAAASASRSRSLPELNLLPTPETPSGERRSLRPVPRDGPRWSVEAGWSGLTPDLRSQWGRAFPACDLDRQLEAMQAWLVANPSRAHKSNWLRFIVNWLTREQNRGGDNRSTSGRDRAAHRSADTVARAHERRDERRASEFAEPGLAARIVFGGAASGGGRSTQEVHDACA